MQIIIYGAGRIGRIVMHRIKEYPSFEILGFIDRNKNGEMGGYPIFTEEDVKKLDKSIPVVIAVIDLNTMEEMRQYLRVCGFTNVYYYAKKTKVFSNDFLQGACQKLDMTLDVVLPYAEMHIVDHCNLNCKACTHFSPLFDKEFPDFETRIKDVRILSKIYGQIAVFHILGGEPLLSPQLKEYIIEIRKLLPNSNLSIATNGLLIPKLDKDVMQCIADNQITIVISEYKPTHLMIDGIIKKLEEYQIDYLIRGYDQKSKFIKSFTCKENSIYPQFCASRWSYIIREGKIAKCPPLMFIHKYNENFDGEMPVDGIIDLDENMDPKALYEQLLKPVPLCKYCIKLEVEWEPCGREIKAVDFVAEE